MNRTSPGKWSSQEDAVLIRLKHEGVSPIAIARQLGRPDSSVYRRIESLALRAERKERPCLCCSNKFMSEGAHNRLCGRCRSKEKTPFDF